MGFTASLNNRMKKCKYCTVICWNILDCERFEHRSHFISRLSVIVWLKVILNRTVVDSDWHLGNLCRGPARRGGSHVARLNFKTHRVGVYKCLSLIVGFAVTVAIWPREVFSCRDFIFGAVATFWAMSLEFTLAGPLCSSHLPRPLTLVRLTETWNYLNTNEWQLYRWTPFTNQTMNGLGLCDMHRQMYSTDFFQGLTLESWFTNITES